ncbi:extracellular solute-binding protein [Acetivibrio clariflavus]|uniref:extracellular solute-binding protein n=1 Tax=Acetivibrio clariflavus TaxID=288965 RepID=UPI0031F4FCBC
MLGFDNNKMKVWACVLFVYIFVLLFSMGNNLSKYKKISATDENDKVKSQQNVFTDVHSEITLWDWDVDNMAAINEDFNKYYPNIKVNMVYVSYDEYIKKIKTAIATGDELPDIGKLEMDARGKLISMDLWENLEAEPFNLDRENIHDKLIPLCVNEEGQVIGIESGPGPAGLAYRRDLAEEYFGTDDPKELEKIFNSWNAFILKGMEVNQKSKGKVFMMSGAEDIYTVLGNQNSAQLIKNGKLNIDDALIENFRIIKEMIDKKVIDRLELQEPNCWQDSFESGRYIFYPCANWYPKYVIKANDPKGKGRWGFMLPPGGPYNWGGSLFSISKTSKNKEAAWTYIKWSFLTREGAVSYRDNMGYLSPYKKIYEDPKFYDIKDDFFAGQALMKIFSGILDDVSQIYISPYDQEIYESIVMGLKGMEMGISDEEALDVVKQDILRKFPELK